MADGNVRSARPVLTLLTAVAAVTLWALPAHADEVCYYDPATGRLVCEDEGGGGGDEEPPEEYWTAWRLIGNCAGTLPGGGLPDISTGLVRAIRDRIVDGEVVETQSVCIDLDEAEEEIWEELATAIAAVPDPGWEANPDGITSPGLTGLDTWLWYSNPSQIGPIEATWTDPATGLVFGVRGRGWTEAITWHTGEQAYDAFASTWDEAPGIGGNEGSPAATHLYNTASVPAGHPSGYPVSLELLWVGEYQVNVTGSVWTEWARFASTLTETFPDSYEVVEVRSSLSR